MSASDRVVCLDGHVCCQGRPEIVATAPAYRAMFGTGTQGTPALDRHDYDHGHNQYDRHGLERGQTEGQPRGHALE